MRVSDWLGEATKKLAAAGIETPRLDAELLLTAVLKCRRESIFLNQNQPLRPQQRRAVDILLARRLNREPLAYILQQTEFFGVKLCIDQRAFIPRPETELLVELALMEIEKMRTQAPLIIDVGTGSGAIALAIALNLKPPFSVIATDFYLDSLFVAKKNLEYHKLSSLIYLLCVDLLEGLNLNADLIISNPPYVAEGEWEELMPEVRNFEPRQALVAGSGGLELIKKLIHQATEKLKPAGILLLEIAPAQKEKILSLFAALPEFSQPEFFNDLTGSCRFVKTKKIA